MSAQTTYASGLTWDEFLALPEELHSADLIDGEVVVNPPKAQHQRIVYNVLRAFEDWARSGSERGEACTEQPIKVTDRRGYQPDLGWYPEEQCSPPDEPAAFTGDPAIVMEVLSPSTKSYDLVRKRADYDLVGIHEVWFVDPVERTVLACRRPGEGAGFEGTTLSDADVLTSPLLDGFVVPIAELFRR